MLASMAGLPSPSAIVCVGPPLSASAPRSGSAVVMETPQVVPGNCMFVPLSVTVPSQLPPVLLAMIVPVI